MTPLLATVHPAFVLRMPRWRPTFESDLAKAIRHARGRLTWRDPPMSLDPTSEALSAALTRFRGVPVAVDTETDGLDPERVRLRCVGLASEDFGIAVGFRSCVAPHVEGRYKPAWGAERPLACSPSRAREMLARFFQAARTPDGPSKIIVHNQVYDAPVLRQHGMPLLDTTSVTDTVILHKLTDSELPHDLDFLSSVLLDCPKWKPAHSHDQWESDEDLHRYCLLDVAATVRIWERLGREVIATDQVRIYDGDRELQRLAIGMHRAGILVDRAEQARHAARLTIAMAAARASAAAAVGAHACPSLASPVQIRRYLYQTRPDIPPPDIYTPAGDPSVDRDAIHEILRRAIADDARAFLESLLDFRRAQKALTSFVTNLNVEEDGRVHATVNAHTQKVGRVTFSNPNLQTVPDKKQDLDSLRSMFVAPEGKVLVGSDYDQIHMRIVAVRANVPDWLECFDLGDRGDTSRRADIHYVNAALFYGKRIDAVENYQRSTVKTLVYAAVYGAGVKTILAQMARVRDPATGQRPYAQMRFEEARELRDLFLRKYPAIPRWWENEVKAWRSGREIRSMIHGRLMRLRDLSGMDRYAADGEESVSEIVNGPSLMTEGDIAGGLGASYKAMRAIGWPWWGDGKGMGGAGLILHQHDSIDAEVAEGRAEEAKAALKESMEMTLSWEGRSVRMTAKPKSARRWSELG